MAAAVGIIARGVPDHKFEWNGDRPYNLAIVDNGSANKSLLFTGVMDFTEYFS